MKIAFAVLLLTTSTTLACGSSSTSAFDTLDASTGETIDGSTNVQNDGGGALTDDAGLYSQGPYTCCGEGTGVSCCTADAGLLGFDVESDGGIVTFGARPGDDQSANCFQYGGTSGSCTAKGDYLDHLDICTVCCAGLTEVIANTEPDDAGACVPSVEHLPSESLCTPCGNGVCDPGENACNCAADCK